MIVGKIVEMTYDISKLFMDFTLKSSNEQFTQIFSAHADFGCMNEETNKFLLTFAQLLIMKKDHLFYRVKFYN